MRIPASGVPLIDQKTGLISREWYRFLFEMSLALPNGVKLTEDGGFAVRYINKTGAPSIKGYCVTTGSANNSVILVQIGVPNSIGVFLEDGVADGAEAWVVVKGKAYVYFIDSTTVGHLARTFITGESGAIAGQALSEAMSTSPFTSDEHFCEIGHVAETRTGAGLALVDLHQN